MNTSLRHLLLFILVLIVIFWFIFPEEFMGNGANSKQ